MSKQRYETGKAPQVVIADCAGDLLIKGSPENVVLINGQHQAEALDEQITVSSSDSLRITLPLHSQIVLQRVAGDAIIKGVEGNISIQEVMGDLALKNTGGAKIGAVYGDMAARNVDGDMAIESVMGDLAVRHAANLDVASIHGDLSAHYINGAARVDEAMGDVSLQTINGEVTLRQVHRDVNLNNLGGILNVERAGGDIRLKGGLSAGKHHCTAGGDVVLRWPVDAPLDLLVSGGTVKDKLGLKDVSQADGGFSGRIGDGETTLVVEAAGRVIVKEYEDADWSWKFGEEFADFGTDLADIGIELGGLGEQISSRVSAQIQEINARMVEKFGHDFAQSMAEKAAKRTERAVQRAMREAERMRVRAGAWTPPPPPPPPPAARQKKAAQVSAEEQAKILNMLQKGIISVEEAEALLQALEE